jgi:hypothetical protein
MSKIAGALNMLPKTILDEIITNDSTNEAIKIYQADRNYPKFYRNLGRLSCCLCRRCRFAGRVLVKSQYGTVACLSSYPR